MNAKITRLDDEIGRLMVRFDTTQALERLDTIPGVNRRVAEVILAELGTDMSRFPTAGHAASWAGLARSIRKLITGRRTRENVN